MKRNGYILIIVIILLLIAGISLFFIHKSIKTNISNNNSKDQYPSVTPKNSPISSVITPTPDSVSSAGIITLQKEIIPSDWKLYTNEKYGFRFQYPSTWVKDGEDADITDLSGNLTATEINFTDALSKTTLLITYHIAPKGAAFYQYEMSLFNSSKGIFEKDSKQIMIAGSKAIEAKTVISRNGKGDILNQPLSIVIVDFLDKAQTGAVELELHAPLSNVSTQVSKLDQLLLTFKFTH